MTNDEKLDLIKDEIKKNKKKQEKRVAELKQKISEIASKALTLSNENYHLKGSLSRKIADCDEYEYARDEAVRVSEIAKRENEVLKDVVYKMYEQIQHMYRATVLPDMFLPGGKVIFPTEIMKLQADWFYSVNEELHDVLDVSRFAVCKGIDDQII